jgi:DNA-binding transcriptional MerR regulator
MSTQRSHALSELVDLTGFDRRTIVYYIQSGLLPKVGRRGPHTRYPDECLSRLLFIKGVRELQAGGQLLTATLAEISRALSVLDAQGIREILDRGLPSAEIERLFAGQAAVEQSAPEPADAAPVHTAAAPAVPAVAPATGSAAPAASPSAGGDRRSYGLADASIRQRFGAERTPAPAAEAPHEDTYPRLPALQTMPSRTPADPISGEAPTAIPGSTTPPAAAGGEDQAELGHLLRELELRPTLNPRRSPPGAPEQWTEIPITSRVYLSVRGLPEEDTVIAESLARLLKRALRARPTAA